MGKQKPTWTKNENDPCPFVKERWDRADNLSVELCNFESPGEIDAWYIVMDVDGERRPLGERPQDSREAAMALADVEFPWMPGPEGAK